MTATRRGGGRSAHWLLAVTGILFAAACGRPSDPPGSRAGSSLPPVTTLPFARTSTTTPTTSTTSTSLRPTTTTTVRPTTTTTTTMDPCANADIDAATRLGSGVDVDRGRTGGSSRLNVENGSGLDATVKLVGKPTLIRHIFVRAAESATASDVPPGDYRLLVSQGEMWDPAARQFQCDRRAFEFVGGADFRESATGHSVLTITLQPVPGGNAATAPISLDAFRQAGS